MKMHRVFQSLLALVLLACLSGVQGQYSQQINGYSAAVPTPGIAQSIVSQSQFYQMLGGPVPGSYIGNLQPFDISGNTPSNVYFSNQIQPIPYLQYMSNPAYFAGTNSLWIKGTQDWTQHAVVPQGATVTLLAISPAGGSGNLNIMDPNGQSYTYNEFFYPYSLFTYYAQFPGQYRLSFYVNGRLSNTVIIDVTGTYVPPSYYLPPINYYPLYYPGYYGYYPWHWGHNRSPVFF